MKVVITGGPSSGKSDLVERLSERGYKTITETARELIKKGMNPRKVFSFQLELAKIQLEKEKEYSGDLTFFDRSAHDGLFYTMNGLGYVPKEIASLCSNVRYDVIFFLDLLPFKKDGERIEENQEEAQIVHNGLRDTYIRLGYNIKRVPVLPIEQRVNFVLKKLNAC
jgi:predicted ATPase